MNKKIKFLLGFFFCLQAYGWWLVFTCPGGFSMGKTSSQLGFSDFEVFITVVTVAPFLGCLALGSFFTTVYGFYLIFNPIIEKVLKRFDN